MQEGQTWYVLTALGKCKARSQHRTDQLRHTKRQQTDSHCILPNSKPMLGTQTRGKCA